MRRAARQTVLPLDWGRVVERFETMLLSTAATPVRRLRVASRQPVATNTEWRFE
jgi:hypothetical protein